MAEKTPQTFENHAKLVPFYHFIAFGILVVNLLWSAWRLIQGFSIENTIELLLAVALLLMFFYLRVFPLKAQDRVIRLEMRLRLRELLPEDLKARIGELRARHLVALRFAPDEEIPDLVRDVLDGKLTSQKEIKRKIKIWNPDYHRL